MDLSVITVTWNSADFIREQLRSVVLGCRTISFEQIVVDNASTDKTVALVQKEFPQVRVIANMENKGFGAGNNQGVAVSMGRYLLFLNADMRLHEGSLDAMVSWMDAHPDVGIASPKLVDEHGYINWDASPRRFPRVWEQAALILKLPHLFPQLLNGYLMKTFNFEKEQVVDSVRGSFFCMRRELVDKLGWAFDPRYFLWFEEVDACHEAKQLGYRVMYTPVISCVDYIGQSFKQRTTLWKQKQFTKSMLTYFQKWEPWWKWVWIAIARPIGISIVWIGEKGKIHF
ncbi:MAG TPA: hypothetical protein DCY48_00075 [Candidatus Magasanikbacteria bacterium]|nr:MAG: hypothetical protein A3I74_04895 [Candidatus Magasanikbacteria bacterium RIFCSPLOWO2_02_FULL_47_16]OGH79750.1 MAG: hypothetical protein A3C10_04045 [Candidatus Magasanikbacteria bacterium RIFCSPHIGHO2_02_FULL_48_18]OGH83081.1 MAG: hypothetical protein A3G08_02595 [Candidatus Magasanikbacteria bacterium RIFCSPLOWO2_12_FULL_47_9b]HAZ28164.1 hypothetical protein [Candidatus Magasanikbacteria bacterium]